MTTYSATFSAAHLEELRRVLLRDDGCEHAAYVLFNKAAIRFDPWDRESHLKFLSAQVIPVSDDQVVESTPNLISWQTASLVSALKRAEGEGKAIAIVHNHPAGLTAFSAQDDANEPKLVTLAQNRNGPETPLLSFILTADGTMTGRVWLNPRYKQPMRTVRVVGENFVFFRPDDDPQLRAAFARQALAFGKALNRDLSNLRVAVAGCGGTGSAVAMLLARIGVGCIVLIDNDIVDVTNLNRLHGARQADADAMTPKVEVVKRAITELGLGVKVIAKEAWVGDPECQDALKSCDVVFGCTDDHDGRMYLNRFAIFYLIPLIDLGLAIHVQEGEPPALRALDGRVTVVVPGVPCLNCRDVTDGTRASEEALRRERPEEYERKKAEAYVFGDGNPSPVVVTFTTELACMAVNELFQRMNKFRGADGARANVVRKFHQMIDAKPGARPRPGCPLCDGADYAARGDMKPFLDRS